LFGPRFAGVILACISLWALPSSFAETNAYWDGAQNSVWNTDIGPGNSTNWATAPTGGVDTNQLPGATTDVYFTANSANNIDTTLGSDFSIQGLIFTGTGTTAGSSSVTIGGTNTLTIGADGISVQAGSAAQTLSSNVALGASETWTNNSANLLTVSGQTSGAFTLTKSGSGTLLLSGSNSYSGATVVNAGVLQLGNTLALGATTGSLTVSAGTVNLDGYSPTVGALSGGSGALITTRVAGLVTLTESGSASTTYAGTLSDGSGQLALIKGGSGTLTLSGADSYSGGTTITGGTLQLSRFSALGAATGNLTVDGGTVDLDGHGVSVGELTGSSGGLITDSVYRSSVTLTTQISANVTYAGMLTDGAGTLALIKNGTWTLTLSGANNYSGGTTINAGTVQLGNNLALGTGAGNLTVNRGTVNLDGYSPSVALLSGGSGAVITTTATILQTITMTGSYGGMDATYAGTIRDGSGRIALVLDNDHASPSVQILSGSNSYSGGTTITAGELIMDNAYALGASTGNLTMGTVIASALDLNVYSLTVGALSGGGGNFTVIQPLVDGGGAAVPVTLATISSQSTTYAGKLDDGDDSLALVKGGSGTLTLTGQGSNYSGGTTITAGTLQLGSTHALGATTGSLTIDGGTLNLDGYSPTVGALSGSSGALITSSKTGAITFTVDTNTASTYAGSINNGYGNIELVKGGTGELTLSGSDHYSGGTVIDAGTLQEGNTYALGSIPANITVNGGTLDLDGFSPSLGTLTGSAGALITDSASGPSTLTLNNTANTTYGGEINDGAGPVSLTKGGTWTLMLTGSSGYSGGTKVTAGAIEVTGKVTATGSASVSPGGALEVDGLLNPSATISDSGKVEGSGSLGAINVASGGTLSPGFNSTSHTAGNLTANGNITLTDNTSIFSIRLGVATASDNDELTLDSGNIALGGATLKLTIGAAYAQQASGFIYVLINGQPAGSTITGEFAQGSSITASNGDVFDIAYGENATDTGSGNDVLLIATAPPSATPNAESRSLGFAPAAAFGGTKVLVATGAVPEPGTWALLLGGLGGLAIWRRGHRGKPGP
jgi:autotransporter-associated beta strand protein